MAGAVQQRSAALHRRRYTAPTFLASGALIVTTLSAPPVQATTCPAGMTAVSGLANVCEREFTANGTFTVPGNANLIEVLIVGGGGGGAGGEAAPLSGQGTGGGGGGAGGVEPFTPDVISGATYRITIGRGGGAGLSGFNGGPGGTTTVNFGLNKLGLETEQSVLGGLGGLTGVGNLRGGYGGASGSGKVGGTVEVSNVGGGGGGGGSGGTGNSNGAPSPPTFASSAGADGGEPTPVIGSLFDLPTGDPYGWGGGGGAGYAGTVNLARGGIGRPGTIGSGWGGNSYDLNRGANRPQDGTDGFMNSGGGGGGGAYTKAGGAGADGIVIVRVRFDAPTPNTPPEPPPGPAPTQTPSPTQAELAEQLMNEAAITRFLAQCQTDSVRSAVCVGNSTQSPTVQAAPKPPGDEFPMQFTMSGTTPDGARWESNVIAQPISAEEWGYFTLVGGISLASLQAQGFTFDRPTTFTAKQLLTSLFGYVPQSRYETALLVNQLFIDGRTDRMRNGDVKATLQPGATLVSSDGRTDPDGTAKIDLRIPADAPSGLYTLRVVGVTPGPQLISLTWPVQILKFGTPVVKETSVAIGFPGKRTTLSSRGEAKTATFAASLPAGASVLETRVVGYPEAGKRKQAKARATSVATALRNDGVAAPVERVRGNGDVAKWPDRAGKVFATIRYVIQQ